MPSNSTRTNCTAPGTAVAAQLCCEKRAAQAAAQRLLARLLSVEQEAQLDIAPRNQRRWRASSDFDGGHSRRRFQIARTADGTARGQNGSPRWAGQPDLRRCGGRANDLQAYLLLAWRSENPSLPRSRISVFALSNCELKIPAMLVNC